MLGINWVRTVVQVWGEFSVPGEGWYTPNQVACRQFKRWIESKAPLWKSVRKSEFPLWKLLSPLGPKDISGSATVPSILNILSPSSWSLKNRKQSWECLEVFLTFQVSWACRDIDICCIFLKPFSSKGKYSFSLFLHSHFLFLSIKNFQSYMVYYLNTHFSSQNPQKIFFPSHQHHRIE